MLPASESSTTSSIDTVDSIQRLRGHKRKREHPESDYKELFRLLMAMTDEEGLEILRRVKTGSDISEIWHQATDANLLLQLSLVPETRRRYQLPYRSGFPDYLKTADNPYLDSLIYGASLNLGSPSQQQGTARQLTEVPPTPYVTPFQATEIVDPYLSNVKASVWTTVTTNDRLVSKLLSSYFLYQYPIFLGFHKGYFLEDMAKGRRRFCSSLLVNTLLAAGCHAHRGIPDRAKYWRPQSLTYKFLAEAKRLWELQVGQSSLTTIQAAIILNTLCDSDTLDKVGRLYMLQAIAMAHDLKLFDSSIQVKSRKMQRARAFTAWSPFIWDSMEAFYYIRPPLVMESPDFPLPDVVEDSAWYGEIWVRYPLDSSAVPTFFGHVVKATMELRHLMHDLATAFFGGPKPNDVPLETVLAFRARLDHWFNNLPDPLASRRMVLPSHFRLHLEYHSLLLSLVQTQNGDPAPDVATKFGLTDEPAANIIARAYNRIETLARLYCLCHGDDVYDPFLKLYFVLLGNRAVDLLEKDPLSEYAEFYRSTLILATKGLYDQGKSHYLEEIIYIVLRNRMMPHDRDILMTYLPAVEATDQEFITQHNQSQYPLPIIKINEDPKTAMLVNLVKEYEVLALSPATSSSSGRGDD